MPPAGSLVAIYKDHASADAAIKSLNASGFDIKDLSIVGKGYRTEEKVMGFYSTADRIKFWGSQGAVWGGLWGLFFGGLYLTLPVIGGVVILGTLATVIIAGIENAVVVGALGALGAGLYSLGIPKDSVVNYETHLETDEFLVMAHGSPDALARAKATLGQSNATSIDIHPGIAVPSALPVAV